jgi:hypothetical protein
MDRINETINSFRDAHPLSEGNQPTPSTR